MWLWMWLWVWVWVCSCCGGFGVECYFLPFVFIHNTCSFGKVNCGLEGLGAGEGT